MVQKRHPGAGRDLSKPIDMGQSKLGRIPASAGMTSERRSAFGHIFDDGYISTMVLKPPKIMRLVSNGICDMWFFRRGSAMTFFMMASRSERDL